MVKDSTPKEIISRTGGILELGVVTLHVSELNNESRTAAPFHSTAVPVALSKLSVSLFLYQMFWSRVSVPTTLNLC